MSGTNLWEQQRSNRRKSTLLVAGFVVFFAWVGFGGDLAFYLFTKDLPAGQYHHVIPWMGLVVMTLAGGMVWYAWNSGSERVLWAAGAREVVEPRGLEETQLVNVVEEMAIAAGQPRPRIFLVPDADPNAFATGLEPQTAAIAVTEGLLRQLNRDELQAVVAHEMAHIRNLDTRLMTLLAAMVGAIALMSDGMGRMLRGGFRGGSSGGGGGKKGGNPLAIVILVLWIISLIIAPIVVRFLSMAVSRKREFLADATGAQFTRNPMALAAALEKLDAAVAPTKAITRGAAHLCIVDPSASQLSAREGLVGDIFASHPPIKQRIARLKGMAYQAIKASTTEKVS